MEKSEDMTALAVLTQDEQLDVVPLLVRAGAKGMPAGAVASALDLAPNTLSFHFDRLRQAGLVTCTRDGRSLIYAAKYDTMNGLLAYLTENCCEGVAPKSDKDCCSPATPAKSTTKSNTKVPA